MALLGIDQRYVDCCFRLDRESDPLNIKGHFTYYAVEETGLFSIPEFFRQESIPLSKDRVYWIFYPKQSQRQTDFDRKMFALFSAIYLLWISQFGAPSMHWTHITALSFIAWKFFGCTHTHIQVGSKVKMGECVKDAKTPDPLTGEYPGLPHLAIEIKVTPTQLKGLLNSIHIDPEGRNCSTKSAGYIEHSIEKTLIPNPWRSMALTSTIYLLAKKALNSEEIGDVEIRGKNNDVRELISMAACYEIVMITVIYPMSFASILFKHHLKPIQ